MTPPTDADDRRVSRALGSSALLRAADRLITVVWDAAKTSRAATWFGGPARRWQAIAPDERSALAGIALLAASASHIALVSWHEVPAGWLWLVPSGIAATIGVMLLLWPRTRVKA